MEHGPRGELAEYHEAVAPFLLARIVRHPLAVSWRTHDRLGRDVVAFCLRVLSLAKCRDLAGILKGGRSQLLSIDGNVQQEPRGPSTKLAKRPWCVAWWMRFAERSSM